MLLQHGPYFSPSICNKTEYPVKAEPFIQAFTFILPVDFYLKFFLVNFILCLQLFDAQQLLSVSYSACSLHGR